MSIDASGIENTGLAFGIIHFFQISKIDSTFAADSISSGFVESFCLIDNFLGSFFETIFNVVRIL